MDYLEKTKKDEAQAYLASQKVAILSTHAADGSIDSAAVFFLVSEQLHFYFTTKTETRKYRNMVANPSATLLIANDEVLKIVEVKGTVNIDRDYVKRRLKGALANEDVRRFV